MVDDSLIGMPFGTYEIIDILGKGGMGIVYKARHTTLDRIVAVKTLAGHLSQDEDFVQRFLQEARAAARLNHTNIIQIYDFGQVELVYYLAMEFVDGKSLGYYLKNSGPFSEAEAISIMRQACAALSCAHDAGVIHRDVKPDNFMLTDSGTIKLGDLGLAKLNREDDQSLTQTGTAMGTPYYISPEQVRGEKDIDRRTDIYSLGATLYHLVTGHIPFTGSTGALIMARHLNDALVDPRQHVPELSEGFCRVIYKMMAKARDDRYHDMAALDEDLYHIQVGEAVKADEIKIQAAAAPATSPSGNISQMTASQIAAKIPEAPRTGAHTLLPQAQTPVQNPAIIIQQVHEKSWLSNIVFAIVLIVILAGGFLLFKNDSTRKALMAAYQDLKVQMGMKSDTPTTPAENQPATLASEARQAQKVSDLIEATKSGNTADMDRLITEGVDINATDYQKKTPAIHAVLRKQTDSLTFLLNKGADLNARDKDGWSPLMHAIQVGYMDGIKLLISKGADVNTKGFDGKTPLALAEYLGDTQVVDALKAAGAQ